MKPEDAYNQWASQYDDNVNLTRDLEGKAMRSVLEKIPFDSCLEIGCGTGKNTVWLVEKAKEMVSVDFSDEMLAQAKAKIKYEKIHFAKADITKDWTFTDRNYDLVTFSLVLEHIKDLVEVFKKTNKLLKPGSHVYVGELHPFKQYSGSKARFETKEGIQVLDCYTHHISDFTKAATENDLKLILLEEFFDNEKKDEIPRILCLLFEKS